MQSTLNQWYSAIQTFVSSLFNLYIAEGVSFGWFLITVTVFSVIIGFLFGKVIKK